MVKNDFIEVTTPTLQPLYGGASARPFKTHLNALDIDMFLRIAPELYLKRLLVGGFEKIYDIGPSWRAEPSHTVRHLCEHRVCAAEIAFIEDEIFRGREQNIVLVISQIRRKIIDFMRTLEPMQILFKDLLVSGPTLLGKDARPYLEYVAESHSRLINILVTQKETMSTLEQTNYSLLSTKTNENIRLLAVYATLLLIPSIIPALFGMNLKNIPFSENPDGFAVVTSIVVISTVMTFFFFKFKRWV